MRLIVSLALLAASTALVAPPAGLRRRRAAGLRAGATVETEVEVVPPPPPPPKVVAVVGATGKVGRRVVDELLATGVGVRAVLRPSTPVAAAGTLLALGVDCVTVGLDNVKGLTEELEGAVAVIDVHGSARRTELADLFPPWRLWQEPPRAAADPKADHPYRTNYCAVENLAAACVAAGVPKVVRLTGLTVGLSAFNPVSVLFSLLLSSSSKWHGRGETALRASGLDYTILRPGGLSEEDTGVGVVASRGKVPPPARISRADVARLAVAALSEEKVSGGAAATRPARPLTLPRKKRPQGRP